MGKKELWLVTFEDGHRVAVEAESRGKAKVLAHIIHFEETNTYPKVRKVEPYDEA